MLGLTLASLAGCCAALASCFAKLAMSPELWSSALCQGSFANILVENGAVFGVRSWIDICVWVVIGCRVVSFIMVFIMNALMWTLFVKSLRKCPSSAVASVTNTGTNFVVTAIAGLVLFGETLSLQWWLGASLVITGLLLIHHRSSNESQETDFERDKKTN